MTAIACKDIAESLICSVDSFPCEGSWHFLKQFRAAYLSIKSKCTLFYTKRYFEVSVISA